MAIGDKPNQNLFGTNYNPEDEEEKRARLAAQGAIMGAGFPALDSNMVAQVPGIENIKNPGAFNPPEPALKNALLEMLERADEREAQGLPRQDAPGIIDMPVKTPSVGAQEQLGEVVSPFLQSPDTPSGLGGPLLRGFNMVNDAARGPNAPMGQDATRAALGGMTLNEYLNAPAGTEGVSGLQTDPQGRMITPSAQPPVDSAVAPATAQPPVDALSSFEKDSLSRQQRIGGTGSFEGDSEAREARIRAEERQPGESQADRDTRIAQGRTTGGQTQGMSFDDARRIAEGQLAAKGVKNPSVSQVNDLSRAIQTQGPASLTPSEQLAREQFEFDKQQALIGDDTSVDATDRKIATIKQANPNISDEDAAAIASGSVRVVSNPITGETQLLNLTTSESKQITGQSSSDVDFDVAVPEQTLFSRAGDFTGFVEATKRKAQGITGQVGLDVATEESLGAAQDFETAQNELVRAFRESSRYAASEAAALKKELNISLSPFEDPKSAEAKLRSIDKSLARRYENEVATFRDTSFPPSDRQDARMRAKAIAEFRANLGVPTSSTQGKVPQGVDPKDWEFMSPEQRNLFN